jgi:hypothetical protein
MHGSADKLSGFFRNDALRANWGIGFDYTIALFS